MRREVSVGAVVERPPLAIQAVIEQHRHVYAPGRGGGQRSLDLGVAELVDRDPDAVAGAVDQRDERPVAGAGLGDQREPFTDDGRAATGATTTPITRMAARAADGDRRRGAAAEAE